MAIVPQRRISKTRKRKRRTHFKLDLPGIMTCPNCGEAKLSHTVCKACGYYDGKQVLEIKANEEANEAVEEKPAKKTKKVKAEEAEVKTTKKATKKAEAEATEEKKAVKKATKKAEKAE